MRTSTCELTSTEEEIALSTRYDLRWRIGALALTVALCLTLAPVSLAAAVTDVSSAGAPVALATITGMVTMDGSTVPPLGSAQVQTLGIDPGGSPFPMDMAPVNPDGTYTLEAYAGMPCTVVFIGGGMSSIEFYDNYRYTGFIPTVGNPDVEWMTLQAGETVEDVNCILGPGGDYVPPTAATDVQESYDGTATITITGEDATGVEDVFYILDGEEPVRLKSDAAEVVVPATLGASEDHSLTFWVKDFSGNASARMTEHFTVDALDKVAPMASCSVEATYANEASITITATDDIAVESVSWRLDADDEWTVMPGDTALAMTDEYGSHTLEFFATDTSGNESEAQSCEFAVVPVAGVFRVAGSTRYATGIEASRRAFPHGADAVVLATGSNWPDALGGSALAGAADGPLLLTDGEALTIDLIFEIGRLGASKVYILGGTGAISAGVEATLNDVFGVRQVIRLAGDDRYETAHEIADEVIKLEGCDFSGDALVATGANYPDALGASPIAAANVMPVLLADPTSGEVYVPAEVMSATILGGTGAVSGVAEEALRAELGDDSVTRIGGADRYATAAMVAAFGVDDGLNWNGVGVTTGSNFPDALAAGSMLGEFNTVMLLTPADALHPSAANVLIENAEEIDTVYIVGGTGSVTAAVEETVKGIIQ